MKLIKNVLLSMIMLLMVALPVVATDVEVVPENKTVENGSQFDLGVDIRNSTNVSSISFNLSYDNDTIEYNSHTIGDFFEEVNVTNESVLENDNNLINISANESVSGEGKLINLTFNATEDNTTNEVNISNLKINGTDVSANITNGSVEVAPEFHMTTITDDINRISNPFQQDVSEEILIEECSGIENNSLEVFGDGSTGGVMKTEKAYKINSDDNCNISLSGKNYEKNKNFTSELSSGINWIGTTYDGIDASKFYNRCVLVGNITTQNKSGDIIHINSSEELKRGKAYKMNLSHPCNISEKASYQVSIGEHEMTKVLQNKSNKTNITLKNEGNRKTNVDINIDNFEDDSWNIFNKENINLNKNSMSLDLYEEKNITLTYNPPLDQTPGVYSGDVELEYENEITKEELNVEVRESTKEISFESVGSLFIYKNKNNELNIGLENTGTEDINSITTEDFNLTKGNETIEANVSINKDSLNSSEEANITIKANASGVEKGDYSGNLTVNYDGNSKNKTIDVQVDEINRSVRVDYSTPTIKEGDNLTHSFDIINNGNIDLKNISFELSELVYEDDSINVELSNISSLGIGDHETVELNASTEIGQVGNYSNDLTVEHDGETTQEEVNVIVDTLIGSVDVAMEYENARSIRGVNLTNRLNITNDGPRNLSEVNVSGSHLHSNEEVIFVTTEDETSFSLDKGESKVVDLTYLISENASLGEYEGDLLVEFQNQSISEDLSLKVEEKERSVNFTNPQIEYFIGKETQADTIMNITNSGNVKTAYNLSVSDLEKAGEFINSSEISLSEESFELKPKKKEEITISVQDLDGYSKGNYNGNVNISYKNNTEQANIRVKIDEAQHGINTPNELFIEDKNRGSSVSKNFTIENAGDFEEESLSISHNIDSKYNASITPQSVTVTQDNSANVELEFDIPEDESFDRHKIGNINLNNNNINKNLGVYLEPAGGLEINNLEVSVDGDDEDVEDGDKVSEEALPGDEVEFDFEIENTLENMEIEDVFVEITIDDIDEGDEIDIESDEIDIDEEDEEDIRLNFDVPYIVEAKDYDVEIYVEGYDEDNNLHDINWDIGLEVEKENHKIIVDDPKLVPEEVSCTPSSSLEADIINAGDSDEDDIRYTIQNSESDINLEEEFELEKGDDDDDSTKYLSESLNIPDDAEKKSYMINFNVYRDDDLEESKTLTLYVDECDLGDFERNESEKDSEENGTEEEDFLIEDAPQPQQPGDDEEKKKGIRDSELYLPILGTVAAGIGVIVLALIPK